MNINDVFSSNYLKSSDVQGQIQLVMARTAMEQLGDDMKLVLFFQGHEKGMVMNKTNSANVANLYGPETDNWIGKPIVLASAMTDYQGKSVPCLRLYPPQQQAAAPAHAGPAQPMQTAPMPGSLGTGHGVQHGGSTLSKVLDDDIPF
jgi:hypothetical protein